MRLHVIAEDLTFGSACAICLDRSGKVLLGRSLSPDDRKGKWCFPGGGIESGEHPSRAAERECYEETGFRSFAVSKPMKYRKKPGVAFVVTRLGGGHARPNEEFSELKWFAVKDALNLEDLYQVNREILINL